MLSALVATCGSAFFAALALEALAVFVEQAGAARSPEEDHAKRGAGTLALFVAGALTPGLLLAHGFVATNGRDDLRLWAMGAPFVAMLGGALSGAVFGAIARGAAPFMRKAALPFDLAALFVAIYATWPSVRALIDAAQHGGVIVTP
jgi:hypothetical protein